MPEPGDAHEYERQYDASIKIQEQDVLIQQQQKEIKRLNEVIMRLSGTVLVETPDLTDLRERLEDYENAAKSAMDERCDASERHCTCVPLLRTKLKEAERELELERMQGAACLTFAEGGGINEPFHDDFKSAAVMAVLHLRKCYEAVEQESKRRLEKIGEAIEQIEKFRSMAEDLRGKLEKRTAERNDLNLRLKDKEQEIDRLSSLISGL